MKFTAGYWEMRPGVRPYYAAQAYDIETDDAEEYFRAEGYFRHSLTVYAPTRVIHHRGDTLNLPVMTVRYSSPLPGVIRVQAYHHKGGKPAQPEFAFQSQPDLLVDIRQDEQFASLTSGPLTVRVTKGESWQVEFRGEGQKLTSSGWRSLGFVDTPEGRFIHEQLGLGVGENVYGLGERFTPFIKNGQVVDMWNDDGGTSSEIAYKNVPFYLTNRGYGVWVRHPECVSFEVASEKVERVQFSVPGENLEYFVIYGPTPRQVLERYTALTGRPALPPPWSFGLWLSTSFTTNYDEATVTSFVQGMAEHGIPLSVFHFDCFWMKEFQWVDFEWDRQVFPDPAGMLQRLKDRGLRICVWINPYIAQRSRLFDEALQNGYLLRLKDGSAYQTDLWQAGMGIVDFTNPAACQWYGDRLRELLALGVDCFKTDFGERIPTDVAYFDGSDPLKMHNYYSYLYNQTVFKVLEDTHGPGKAVVFARSATTGGQQFPVHWGGDCTATFESMAESLRGGLSLGLSGFGFWSHDIGGFEQTANASVYKRWCAFGLLSSHSRLHGSGSYRVPWLFDDEAVEVLQFFTRLKCSLMPYLFQSALQAHQQGLPMLRAMLLEFPEDPACETLDRQYLLGDSLLVAPVFSSEGWVDYYLPAGEWTHLLTGETRQGPGWLRERHGFMSLPLFVRPNTILPVGSSSDRPDYDYADGVTLQIYELAEGLQEKVVIPTPEAGEGVTFQVEKKDQTITITLQGRPVAWQVLLVGIDAAASVEGGTVESTRKSTSDSLGLKVKIPAGIERVTITTF